MTLVAILAALAASLVFTGAAAPRILIDPGAIVRWGMPLVTALVRGASIMTIGAFSVAAFTMRGPTPRDRAASPAWKASVRIGTVAALVWVVAQAVYVIFGYGTVWGRNMAEPTFGDELWFFMTRTDLGVTYVWETILAIVVSVLAVSTTTMVGALWTASMGAIALVPVALTGHAAGAVAHNLAVSAAWMHLVPLGLWAGGLATLVFIHRLLGDELPAAAQRYSAIALWSFALMAVSGFFATLIRLNGPEDLWGTRWGVLVLVKVALFAFLGWAGWEHRRRTIPQLTSSPGLFVRLAAAEVAVMGAVMGVGIALSSSAPPVPQEPVVDASAVFLLSSYAEPPAPTFTTWFTQWHWDPMYLAIVFSAIFVYLRWVVRLRRRGDSWPMGRTVLWVISWIFFGWLVMGGPYVYGVTLFSAHMVMHMALVMVLPILLVLSAPITLLLRAVPPRRDGSRGPREWILSIVHSWWAKIWSSPVVAGVNFVGSLFLFYYTPLMTLALTNHVGHVLMVVHFSLAGYFLMNLVIGIDPGVDRPPHAQRLIILFAAMIFHAFFGLSLAQMSSLLGAEYFGRLGLSWWVDAMLDQQIGGFITWGIGELPTLIIAVILAWEWSRQDAKDAQRIDRRADRDHDAELAAYNEMLRKRAEAMDAQRAASH